MRRGLVDTELVWH